MSWRCIRRFIKLWRTSSLHTPDYVLGQRSSSVLTSRVFRLSTLRLDQLSVNSDKSWCQVYHHRTSCRHLHLGIPHRRRQTSPPSYWAELSGELTDLEKTKSAQEIVNKIISDLPEKSIVVYTDGSCLNYNNTMNVGPCGAGVVIFQNGHDKVELHIPISSRSTVFLAELNSVDFALDYLIKNSLLNGMVKIQIFLDSQDLIKCCVYGKKPPEHADVVRRLKQKLSEIKSVVDIAMDWIPSHTEVEGNEQADELAKFAAREASTLPLDAPLLSEVDVKRAMRQFVKVTGSRGTRKDYSDNVLLAILMKKKDLGLGPKQGSGPHGDGTRTPHGNNCHDNSPTDTTPASPTTTGTEMDLKDRRVVFMGIVLQDNLHRLVSKSKMCGCSVDSKLSTYTDFVVYGSQNTETIASIQQKARKMGVQCISSASWERLLARSTKVMINDHSEDEVESRGRGHDRNPAKQKKKKL